MFLDSTIMYYNMFLRSINSTKVLADFANEGFITKYS